MKRLIAIVLLASLVGCQEKKPVNTYTVRIVGENETIIKEWRGVEGFKSGDGRCLFYDGDKLTVVVHKLTERIEAVQE